MTSSREEEQRLIDAAIADGKLRRVGYEEETKPRYRFAPLKPHRHHKRASDMQSKRFREAQYKEKGLA